MSNLATLVKFKKGDKRSKELASKGGKNKKGYKSLKAEIDEVFDEMMTNTDGKKITLQKAMIVKLAHQVVKQGDVRAFEALSNRKEGAPKATLDLSIREKPVPIYGGKSRKK